MTTGSDLVVLSAGAAKVLVEALAGPFREETGAGIAGTFGAVGAIRERFLAAEACDVVVLTAPMLDGLASAGQVVRETVAPLGQVLTGVAVRAGERHPPIADREQLRACFASATALYCPDTVKATAGIHFVRVLEALGLWPDAMPRLREHPSGAIAMRALGDDRAAGSVGCTQVTEILYTAGVELVGILPDEFRLATTYSIAVASRAAQPQLARRFAGLLSGPGSGTLRAQAGFVAAP